MIGTNLGDRRSRARQKLKPAGRPQDGYGYQPATKPRPMRRGFFIFVSLQGSIRRSLKRPLHFPPVNSVHILIKF
jgi:hypothetical protein